MKYYCLYCGWNANVEFFETSLDGKTYLDKKWICYGCGCYGYCIDPDCACGC
jgi:hypothetical protein